MWLPDYTKYICPYCYGDLTNYEKVGLFAAGGVKCPYCKKKIAKGRYGLMKDNYLTTILSIFAMVTIVVLYILRMYGIL